jgi:hypothetical protein
VTEERQLFAVLALALVTGEYQLYFLVAFKPGIRPSVIKQIRGYLGY